MRVRKRTKKYTMDFVTRKYLVTTKNSLGWS